MIVIVHFAGEHSEFLHKTGGEGKYRSFVLAVWGPRSSIKLHHRC